LLSSPDNSLKPSENSIVDPWGKAEKLKQFIFNNTFMYISFPKNKCGIIYYQNCNLLFYEIILATNMVHRTHKLIIKNDMKILRQLLWRFFGKDFEMEHMCTQQEI
jgi:hypothetical protein